MQNGKVEAVIFETILHRSAIKISDAKGILQTGINQINQFCPKLATS